VRVAVDLPLAVLGIGLSVAETIPGYVWLIAVIIVVMNWHLWWIGAGLHRLAGEVRGLRSPRRKRRAAPATITDELDWAP